MPPVQNLRTYTPKFIKHFNRSSVDVVTFETNIAGAIKMCMQDAPAGHKISFRYGELLFPDGTLNGVRFMTFKSLSVT